MKRERYEIFIVSKCYKNFIRELYWTLFIILYKNYTEIVPLQYTKSVRTLYTNNVLNPIYKNCPWYKYIKRRIFTMDEVTVATIGLGFNPNESLTSKKLPFPQNAEIFSVKSKGNDPTIQITYMAPAENFEKRPYDYITIVISSLESRI